MSATRTAGMAAANPITFPDIDAWARLTGAAPSPWEVGVIRRMDAAMLAAAAKSAPSPRDDRPAPIDASDGREVVGFMRMMAARKRG